MQPFFGFAQNEANPSDIPTDVPVSAALSASVPRKLLRQQPVRKGLPKKYNRSAMEKRPHLQCKALQGREKRRWRKNNGKQ